MTNEERYNEINRLMDEYYRTGNDALLHEAQRLMVDCTGLFA